MDGWDYTKKSGHLTYLADEPYLGIDMSCDPDILTKPNGLKGYRVTGYDSVRTIQCLLALYCSTPDLSQLLKSQTLKSVLPRELKNPIESIVD